MAQMDQFTRDLEDVRRGLAAIGWSKEDADDLVKRVNENRHDLIKALKQIAELENGQRPDSVGTIGAPQKEARHAPDYTPGH